MLKILLVLGIAFLTMMLYPILTFLQVPILLKALVLIGAFAACRAIIRNKGKVQDGSLPAPDDADSSTPLGDRQGQS